MDDDKKRFTVTVESSCSSLTGERYRVTGKDMGEALHAYLNQYGTCNHLEASGDNAEEIISILDGSGEAKRYQLQAKIKWTTKDLLEVTA